MEGESPSQSNRFSTSSSSRSRKCKEFCYKLLDSELLAENLQDWFHSFSSNIDPPFERIDLQKFDYALEGIAFQQLIRMPSAVYTSAEESVEATAYLAIEDFLHSSVKALWEAFWSQDHPNPFSVACLHNEDLRFYQAEKAITSGNLQSLCATGVLLNNPKHPHGKWDHIIELALLRPDIRSNAHHLSLSVIGEALFYGVRVLLSRTFSRSNTCDSPNTVYLLLVDSQFGGVVKVEGDVSKMDLDLRHVYECCADWIRNHCKVSVSSIERVWNKLGNANWGDIGAIQILYATFHCIVQFAGTPNQSIEDLAADHGTRLQSRKLERNAKRSGNGVLTVRSPEIVEVAATSSSQCSVKLEVGSVLWLDDADRKGFEIQTVVRASEGRYYIASPVDDQTTSLCVYVGSRLSALEDTHQWYQVQRQTKILSIMRQNGITSKYLPQIVSSGRIIDPDNSSSTDHPWFGTPVLVTSPVGDPVSEMLMSGRFASDDVARCCHDCLSALAAASTIGMRHGDIRPDNVIFVRDHFVLVGWGHAVVGEKDRPAMNLHFSSTYALQEGKLCSSSDAESLLYMLYFLAGGDLPVLDSVEGSLQWRDAAWSRRLIQQKLGDVSTALKAFADYVNTLCGTPYPVDYSIWLRRLR